MRLDEIKSALRRGREAAHRAIDGLPQQENQPIAYSIAQAERSLRDIERARALMLLCVDAADADADGERAERDERANDG